MAREAATEDNPEWTADDFAKAKPAADLPPHIRAAFPRTLSAQKTATRTPV